MAKAEPRLTRVLPLPISQAEAVFAFTDYTILTPAGIVLPRDLLLEISPKLFLALAAYGNVNTPGATAELRLGLQHQDTTIFPLPPTTLRFTETRFRLVRSPAVDVTTEVGRGALSAVRLIGRVSAGFAGIAAPTLLVLRQDG